MLRASPSQHYELKEVTVVTVVITTDSYSIVSALWRGQSRLGGGGDSRVGGESRGTGAAAETRAARDRCWRREVATKME